MGAGRFRAGPDNRSRYSGRLYGGKYCCVKVDSVDELEFRRFVMRRGSALCRSAYLLTGDWQLGEDLVQIALANTWRRRWRLRNVEALEAYVHRSMVRTQISWRRRRSSLELPVDEPTDQISADHSEAVLERDSMWAALTQLPAKQRAVLVLRYYEDLSEHQIADVLGCSTGTVKSHASRGIDALRKADHSGREKTNDKN